MNKDKLIKRIAETCFEQSDEDVIKEIGHVEIKNTRNILLSALGTQEKPTLAIAIRLPLDKKKIFYKNIISEQTQMTAQYRNLDDLTDNDLNIFLKQLQKMGLLR